MGAWAAGVWAATPVWADGVWFGMGGEQPAQPAAEVAPGWGSVTRRRKRRKAEDEPLDERPVELPAVQADRDAPLREFIARQELLDRSRPSAPEPRPFDPAPMLERIEAARLEAERRKRRITKFLLLLTE